MSFSNTRRAALVRLAAGSAVLASGSSFAQAWPTKPVRIVTAFAAGSASDIVARLYAQELQAEYGQPFIVENKPGASGMIAAEMVARSPSDGYTLMLTTNTINSANPYLFKKIPYDPIKDFTPVARVCTFPFVLVVAASSPIKTVPDLIAYAKANPKTTSFAYGNSTGQIAGAAFNNLAQLGATAVPYKSTPQAITGVGGGEVTFLFVDLASSQALLKSGRLRALAVTTETKSRQAPELPTIAAAANLPGFNLAAWVGIVAPAAMPSFLSSKLSTSINKITAKKAVADKLVAMGADLYPGTSAELGSFMMQQLVGWREKIKVAGIQAE